MSEDKERRRKHIMDAVSAAFEVISKSSAMASPTSCVSTDEIWLCVEQETMSRVTADLYVYSRLGLMATAYDPNCDVTVKEPVSFAGVISQFLTDEGGDDKEACQALRADLKAALALLPTDQE